MHAQGQNVTVGQVVILVDRYGEPKTANVTKVTRTGQFYVDGKGTRYKPGGWKGYAIPVENTRYDTSVIHLYSEEKWQELNDAWQAAQRRQAERREEENRKRDERERERLEQIETVKAAIGGSSVFDNFMRQDMPDGTRIYTGMVPVHEGLEERKSGWSWMAVKCKDVEEYKYDTKKKERKVEFAVTYADGSSGSFPSCSSEKVESDEDAILEAARYVHFNW